MENPNVSSTTLSLLCDEFRKNNRIEPETFQRYKVKRGLRNSDGSGVVAGLTMICNVHGYVINEGDMQPEEGRLVFRGMDIEDLVNGCVAEGRFGFEETAWLLLFGKLPTAEQLKGFTNLLSSYRNLPMSFMNDLVSSNHPCPNIMNKLGSAILSLYAYDDKPDDLSLENVMHQSVGLLAKMPLIMAYSYQAIRHYIDNKSMVFHPNILGLSTAEIILRSIRSDASYTAEEARLLDICLMLHAEHGGGNASAFTSRVLTSTGTDTYAALSASIGALKGNRHGGANVKVTQMLDYMKAENLDPADDDAVRDFLRRILRKEAGDGSGLIYGMGHAVYTLSDPRAILLKKYARDLAEKKGFGTDFRLLEAIERLTPEVVREVKHHPKPICANVDLYSGLVYRTLGINAELFTPLFAVARTAGWSAHRIEELFTGNRIIRPAYKAIAPAQAYVPLAER